MANEIHRLSKSYGDCGLILCIGAGVSAASGVPDWRELLRRVGDVVFAGSGGADVIDQLLADGYSLPAIAGIVEAQSGSRMKGHRFAELIRSALYRDLVLKSPAPDQREMTDFASETQQRNPTLRSVAALCVTRDQETGCFSANHRIRAIINLNYDALLRSYVRYRYGTILVRTIERPDAVPKPDRIPVYHPHGFLHFNQKYCGDLDSETPDQLVLTEQDYFDFFSRPLSLFTYTMLFLMREHPFLFIGTKLKDDNIRRLLHYSKQERLAGFERRGKRTESLADRHFAILRRRPSAVMNRLTEASLQRLGVRVIWSNTHDDIPELLKSVYESDGSSRWAEVF